MPTEDRDFGKTPYTADERRVAGYLHGLGAGGGDDPVGFILVSHAELARQNRVLRARLKGAGLSTEVDLDEDPAPPAAR